MRKVAKKVCKLSLFSQLSAPIKSGVIGPFLRGDFFFRLQSFFCFQVSYCPVKRGNRAGSSRNEFLTTRGEVPRPFFRFSRVTVAIISDYY